MDVLNPDIVTIKMEPGNGEEGGGELPPTDMEIDLLNVKQECLQNSTEVEQTADSVSVEMGPGTAGGGGGGGGLQHAHVYIDIPDVGKECLARSTGVEQVELTPVTHPKENHSGKLKRKIKLATSPSKSVKKAAVHGITDQSDIVHYLLKHTPFSKISLADQLKIMERGRPTPDLKIIHDKQKNNVRKFKLNTYTKYSWIAGSTKLKRMFCWPCILFPDNINVWNSSGYNDLTHYTVAAVSHEQKQDHYQAVLAFNKFGSVRIETGLSTQRNNEIFRHNEKAAQNRCVFRRLIDITCLLAKQEIPLLGHNESVNSANRGNFLECVNLVSQYDGILGNHLQGEKKSIFRDVSDDTIKTDTVDAISCVIINRVKSEINNSDFVALIVEETPDVIGFEQLCFILRYLTGAKITERFLGFIDVSADRSAASITEAIINKLKEYDCISKLIAQSYDGTAVVSSSKNEVHSKVKLQCPDAMFVWCGAHVLNLVLSKSCERIPETRKFFNVVKSIGKFFQASTTRTEFYNQLCNRPTARVAATRWAYDSHTIYAIASGLHNLIEFFENITDLPDAWDGETISSSESYLFSLRDFEFMFFIHIFEQILKRADKLFKIIQNGTTGTDMCVTKIQQFKYFVKNFPFDSCYATAIALTREPRIKRNIPDIKVHYSRIFEEIKENILSEVHERYKSINGLTFLELLESGFFPKFSEKFPTPQFSKLKSQFPVFFDFGRLKNELICVYRTSEFAEKKLLDILEFFVENRLNYAFPQLIKLASLLITIPARSVSTKGSFSALKRIHTYLSNTQNQKRISNLSIITIEKDLLTSLRSSGTFYDDVISEFLKQEKRIHLAYALDSVDK